MKAKTCGSLIIGELKETGECLRFRRNMDGAWFEYVPPQHTGQNAKIFKLDDRTISLTLKMMMEDL